MRSTRSPVQSTTLSGGLSRRMALACLSGGTAALLATAQTDRSKAQATPPPRGEEGAAPNHFALSGAETQLTYDAATAAGEPRLTYDGPYGTRTVIGDEIRAEESALGPLVTVYLGAFPDQGELWLTLLLPRFNSTSSADPDTPFATLAILKWVISTIAGPPRIGALEEYRVLPLAGTARLVLI
jgi:hypothetical protein